MAIALVTGAHAIAQGNAGVVPVTSVIDTSGASLLVLAVSSVDNLAAAAPQDSKSNTWNALALQGIAGGSPQCKLYYATGAISVGSGHTFTTAGGVNEYACLSVAAFSGVVTSSPLDAQNGTTGSVSGLSSLQPGSITPTNAGELLVTTTVINSASITGISLTDGSNSITLSDWAYQNAGVAYSGGLGYEIQTTAAASNPTWSWSSATSGASAAIAAFIAAAGGTTNLTIPLGSLSLNDQLPTIKDTRAMPVASVVLTAQAPTLGGGTALTIPVASMSLTDQVPNLTSTLTAPVASLSLTGNAPTLTTTLNAPAAAVVLTAGGPTLSLQIAVPVASLVFNGLAPSLVPVTNINAPAASLVLTDFAPTMAMTLKVPSAPISIGGQAPTLIGGNQSSIFEWDQRARRRRGR